MFTGLLKDSWPRITFTCLISVISGLANILLLRIVNEYATAPPEVISAIFQYGGILFFMVGIGFVSQYLLMKLSGNIFHQIRKELTDKISKLSYQQLESVGGYRLYTALTTDIAVISGLVAVIPTYLFNLTVIICCLVYMAVISPQLFIVSLLFLSFTVLLTRYFVVQKAMPVFREARNLQDNLFACYESVIEGFKELKFNPHRKSKIHDVVLHETSSQYRDRLLHTNTCWAIATSLNIGLIFTAIGVIIASSVSLFQVSQEQLMQFVVVMIYMISPTSFLSNIFRDVSKVRVAVAKLGTLNLVSQLDDELETVAESNCEFGSFSTLRLRDVEFTYSGNEEDNGTFSIGPLSLEVCRGETVFLIGGNGSGKTTVAKIISGLYRIEKGSLEMNGVAINSGNLSSYYGYFSTIFSDYYLFDEIMSKNGIVVPDSEIRAFANKLRLPKSFEIADGSFSTIDLSQGQRKRVALLIAYFEDAEIYIFDEWASDQDPEFRDYFYNSLLEQLKQRGKTIIVVTHDDRYFDVADKLVKLEYGRVVLVEERQCGGSNERYAERRW